VETRGLPWWQKYITANVLARCIFLNLKNRLFQNFRRGGRNILQSSSLGACINYLAQEHTDPGL
jgi:hypothetical protein